MKNETGPTIDFHAHAFPDALAGKAVPMLAEAGAVTPALDGKISSLLDSMERAGIVASVICSIATRPGQFEKILDWSKQVASDRIIPLPSVHPEDEDVVGKVETISRSGFIGIKMHPYYQEFSLDETRMTPFYEAVAAHGLLLESHTGFDVAYPRNRICDPVRIRRLTERFPELKFIATHLGGWEDWEEVEKHLIGRPIYIEISFSLAYLPAETARRMLLKHPADYLLFGTDSPWANQHEELLRVRALELPAALERKLLFENAARLLEEQWRR